MRAADCNAMLQSVPLTTTETNRQENHYHTAHFSPHFWNTTTDCESVNKQAKHHTSICTEVCYWEDADSIIIIQDVFIPVDTMKHCDTMGYTYITI